MDVVLSELTRVQVSFYDFKVAYGGCSADQLCRSVFNGLEAFCTKSSLHAVEHDRPHDGTAWLSQDESLPDEDACSPHV